MYLETYKKKLMKGFKRILFGLPHLGPRAQVCHPCEQRFYSSTRSLHVMGKIRKMKKTIITELKFLLSISLTRKQKWKYGTWRKILSNYEIFLLLNCSWLRALVDYSCSFYVFVCYRFSTSQENFSRLISVSCVDFFQVFLMIFSKFGGILPGKYKIKIRVFQWSFPSFAMWTKVFYK